MAKVRMSLEMSEDIVHFLDNIAEREGATRVEIMRRAFAVLKAFDKSWQKGRGHIGFVKDPDQLDAEIVGVFNVSPPRETALTL